MRFLTLLLLLVLCPIAFAQDARQQLNQYVAELQKSPDDAALREKIIKLAVTLDPQPAIPEEARRHFVKAVTIQKDAKDAGDYELAIKEYKEALLLAAWWPESYFNLGVAEESAGNYDEAIKSLKLYLLTKPTEADARAAQDKIYALEAKQELGSREKEKAAERVRLKAEEDARKAKAQSLEGFWAEVMFDGKYGRDFGGIEISQNGSVWNITRFSGRQRYAYQPTNISVSARSLSFDLKYGDSPEDYGHSESYLSEDGKKLTGTYISPRNGSVKITYIRVD